jgi:hypothetical protein
MSFVFKIEKSSIQNSLIVLTILLYIVGAGMKLFGFYSIQQDEGIFVGNLVFEKDYIQINELQIDLEKIKNIEIRGVDWIGLRSSNYVVDFNYENGLSNGVENYLILILNDGERKKIQFQKNDACEFSELHDHSTLLRNEQNWISKLCGYFMFEQKRRLG